MADIGKHISTYSPKTVQRSGSDSPIHRTHASLNGTIPRVPKTEPENEKEPDGHKGGK